MLSRASRESKRPARSLLPTSPYRGRSVGLSPSLLFYMQGSRAEDFTHEIRSVPESSYVLGHGYQ